jgi:hypothetical protein
VSSPSVVASKWKYCIWRGFEIAIIPDQLFYVSNYIPIAEYWRGTWFLPNVNLIELCSRVSDPHWFNADPDTDPDPAFFLIADPDPDPDPGFDDLKLKKIYSWKFNFYFLDQKLQFTVLKKSGSTSLIKRFNGNTQLPIPENQCCGSVTFWYGFGSADPYHWLTDPDSAPDNVIFVSDLQDGGKKILNFFAYYFLKIHLHPFSKIKINKEVSKQ